MRNYLKLKFFKLIVTKSATSDAICIRLSERNKEIEAHVIVMFKFELTIKDYRSFDIDRMLASFAGWSIDLALFCDAAGVGKKSNVRRI